VRRRVLRVLFLSGLSLVPAGRRSRFKEAGFLNDRINPHFLSFTRVLIPNGGVRASCIAPRGLLCLSAVSLARKGINPLPARLASCAMRSNVGKRPRAIERAIYIARVRVPVLFSGVTRFHARKHLFHHHVDAPNA